MKIATLATDAQVAAQTLVGEKYAATVAPWRELLRGLAEAHNISRTDAMVTLLTDLQGVGLLDGAAAMWILAAFSDEALGEPQYTQKQE